MRSDTILEITTSISNYEVSMERTYASIRCTGSIDPPCMILSTIQRYRIKQLHARIAMLNAIPIQIPNHS